MSRRLESFEDISVEVSNIKLNVLEVETQRSIVYSNFEAAFGNSSKFVFKTF